ncbi:MAG TPA: 1-acyl-sn-glycerol-3-phosphate acyltransferase [Thermoanaerobaculaceae bacterium]|nr:1-acyl-sn-glycerol-3-phosphate acyltransferase [Thermoanaerobaculaceae bacterium]
MGQPAFVIAAPDCSDRRNVYFVIAKTICLLGHRFLVRPHVELDGALPELRRRGDSVFLYCGLHKSLWETSGVMPPLYFAGLPLPYVGMGDNLIKGRVFQAMSKRLGTFLVQRPNTRREMLESARRLRDDVLSFLAHGLDVMVFPEGTRKNIPARARYGDFFPAAFDAVLEYERNRDAIRAANPELKPYETFVVPFNVDYTRVREAEEMTGEGSRAPRTLHVLDSLSMIRSIGDTYLSYGKPIRVRDHLELDRKGLAALCRQRCLDLVKILPVNVASRAMLQFDGGNTVSTPALHDAIRRVVDALRPYADRFRGFRAGDAQAEIVRRARQVQVDFRRLLPDKMRLYRLYASYIGHYLEASPLAIA